MVVSVFPMQESLTVNNDHGRTQKWNFSALNRKYLDQIRTKNSELCVQNKTLIPRLIRICNGDVQFSYFRLKRSFLGKFGPKNQNCQFKLKFGTLTNSNKQKSMVSFTFHVCWPNHLLKLKLGTYTNLEM